MQHLRPPEFFNHLNKEHFKIFLAGSIEMDTALDWQLQIVNSLNCISDRLVVLNPRRLEWDSSWTQDISCLNFKQQVYWELDALEKADLVLLYFDPNTRSPISLLEMGLFLNKCVVCCPNGFWRKGNVDVVCEKYNILSVDSLDELISIAIEKYENYEKRV